MANKKISQLTSLPQSQFAAGDSIPIVDQSAGETKRTTIDELDLRWAANAHTHVISDVTGLTAALSGKSDVGHTHVAADITDFNSAVQGVLLSEMLVSVADDFIVPAAAGQLGFTITSSGTGAGATVNNAISDTSVFGNRQLSTGTTATGRVALSLSIDSVYFTGIFHSIEWKVRLDAISTVAVEQYVAYIGWGDTIGSGDMIDGVYFRYDATVSSNWLAVTSSNSVREITDTGIAVGALTYNQFRIDVNNTASEAKFFINGTLVATNTLNIPSTQARACGALIKIEKQVGVSARLMQIDRVQMNSRR